MDKQTNRQPRVIGLGLRRHFCRLEAETEVTARIRDISARGAFLETGYRPPLGSTVRLRHRPAGVIEGRVSGHSGAGVTVAFPAGEDASAFALAVIASGMAQPAA